MAVECRIYGLTSIPEITTGADLTELISRAATTEGVGLQNGDIVVVSSKATAKAEGRVVDLGRITPSPKAVALGRLTGKDARRVEVILGEMKSLVGYIPLRKLTKDPEFIRHYFGSMDAVELLHKAEAVLLTEMPDGSLATDAGSDLSNTPGQDSLTLLPKDPVASARRLRAGLQERFGSRPAVIISDSEVRMLRFGTAEIALGWCGIRPISRAFGAPDMYGKPKFGGVNAVADEAACAAGQVLGQTDQRIPAAIIRGLNYAEEDEDGASARLGMPVSYQQKFVRMTVLSYFRAAWCLKLAALRSRLKG